jgi:hypothetical protein
MWRVQHLRLSMELVSTEMAWPMTLVQQGRSNKRPSLSSEIRLQYSTSCLRGKPGLARGARRKLARFAEADVVQRDELVKA